MSDRFVSEKELEERRKKRQEEWDRVRTAEDPKEAPDPGEVEDKRPLYERLKEQKDKQQLEYDEAHRFKNMFRGLDSEETAFLDFVDNMKEAEEKKRQQEEKELVDEVQKAAAAGTLADPPSTSATATHRPVRKSKQAEIMTAAVKRKSCSTAEERSGSSERKRLRGNAMVECGVRAAAMECVGLLPGLADYNADSSDDSSDSESSDSDADFFPPPRAQMDSDAAQPGKVSRNPSHPDKSLPANAQS